MSIEAPLIAVGLNCLVKAGFMNRSICVHVYAQVFYAHDEDNR